MSAESRMATMRDNDIYTCPSWCLQSEDEGDYEDHLGAEVRVELRNDPNVELSLRPRQSWWPDENGNVRPSVLLSVITHDGKPSTYQGSTSMDGAVVETDLPWADLAELLTTLREQFDIANSVEDLDDEDTWNWAYPGAEDDAEAAEQAAASETVISHD